MRRHARSSHLRPVNYHKFLSIVARSMPIDREEAANEGDECPLLPGEIAADPQWCDCGITWPTNERV